MALRGVESGQNADRMERLDESLSAMTSQPPLIPLSGEELLMASRELARLVGQLEILEQEHAEIRKEQKTEKDALEQKIAAIASTIRNQGR